MLVIKLVFNIYRFMMNFQQLFCSNYLIISELRFLSGLRDSNPRPSAWEANDKFCNILIHNTYSSHKIYRVRNRVRN